MAFQNPKTLLIIFIYLVGLSMQAEAGYKCFNFLSKTEEFYNINKLSSDSATVYNAPVTLKLKDGSDEKGIVYFNVCNSANVPPSYNCNISLNSIGYFVWQDEEKNYKCKALSTYENSTSESRTRWTYKPYNPDADPDGYVIMGDNSNTTDPSSIGLNVRLEIKCDSEASTPQTIFASQDEDQTVYFGMTSKTGCGKKSFGPLGDLISLGWPLYILGIAMGLTLVTLGYKIFKPSLTIIIFTIVFFVIYGFLNVIFDGMDQKLKTYISLGFAVTIGLILCYFIAKNMNFSYIVAGIFLGGVIGFNLYILLDLFEHEKDGSTFLLWCVLIVCSILVGASGLKLKDHILINATSFGGSYLVLKSIGDWTGTYPDEFNLSKKVKAGTLHEVPKVFWVYFSLLLVMGLGGTIYQYILRKRDRENDEANIQVYAKAETNEEVSVSGQKDVKKRRDTLKDIDNEYSKFTED